MQNENIDIFTAADTVNRCAASVTTVAVLLDSVSTLVVEPLAVVGKAGLRLRLALGTSVRTWRYQ